VIFIEKEKQTRYERVCFSFVSFVMKSRNEDMYNSNMVAIQSSISRKKLAAFCKRWKVVEFALFGSALREDFSAESDIDALVSFAPQSDWSLFDHVRMQQELKELFGREVDLITRRSLEQSHNVLLRSEILSSAKVLYSEGKVVDVQASR
jgi:uncharacterized protein